MMVKVKIDSEMETLLSKILDKEELEMLQIIIECQGNLEEEK